jgi:hypothetical protein
LQLRAARRADELLNDGDVDGSAVWGLAAFKELRRGRRERASIEHGEGARVYSADVPRTQAT